VSVSWGQISPGAIDLPKWRENIAAANSGSGLRGSDPLSRQWYGAVGDTVPGPNAPLIWRAKVRGDQPASVRRTPSTWLGWPLSGISAPFVTGCGTAVSTR
jgi:hypothetical protein